MSLPSGPFTFQPKRGKAILWPSVKADSPHEKDERTDHEALPVTQGEKFGGAPPADASAASIVTPVRMLYTPACHN